MKPALGYSWKQPLTTWQQLPVGSLLKDKEYEVLAANMQGCFGYHMLKLGSLAAELDTSECTIPHQVNLVQKTKEIVGKIGLVAEYDELPISNHCIDLVIANHILEFSVDPHHVLREIHRVLMPNGKLLLTLYNPYSQLFLSKFWPFKAKSPLWQARLFSVPRVKDWLNLLGFEIKNVEYCSYVSFLKQNSTLKPNLFQTLLAKLMPWSGSVCIINAKKREWPLTPIRPRLRYKSAFRPSVTVTQVKL